MRTWAADCSFTARGGSAGDSGFGASAIERIFPLAIVRRQLRVTRQMAPGPRLVTAVALRAADERR
jgi:hypothetical protein